MSRRRPSERSLRSKLTVVLFIAFATGPLLLLSQWAVGPGIVEAPAGQRAIGLVAGAMAILVVTLGVAVLAADLVLAPMVSGLSQVSRARTLEELCASAELVAEPAVGAALRHVTRVAVDHRQQERGRLAFLAALIHDLKTRIAGLSLLLEPGVDHEPRDLMLIRHELGDVQTWLARTLDAIRLDRLERLVQREAFALRPMVAEVIARVAAADDLDVAVYIEGHAEVSADRVELARAITNLVANARKAARSRVSVEIYPGLVRVSDDGRGLSAPFEVLTQPFLRVETGPERLTTTGTGLGLFVARRILELHGGRLVCERSDDRGTVMLAYVGR